ncbi:cupin domain-containing protein [Roseomonas sp. NAR14]|uniref:Cupin domain-containing protein n=1 Tax=Roseomonas acroporae TaxID=2937791 RepID=A0A9X2BWL1_9PROT|nr:cupin domain-containing protein [Roseomonas acroporae]MCK8787918.1 cupin domain-containing protein [Roseomonas acroporae]
MTLDLRDPGLEPRAVVAALGLRPHPEGGHYREIWRDAPAPGGRGAGTAIYYLLAEGEASHWHRVDAVEAWHWYGGAPLALSLSPDGREVAAHRLGPALSAGEAPFAIVPAGCWQAARTLGRWTLVGCTVCPAFDFAGFEMAPPGWQPGTGPR